ncbi:hypothetical protein C1H46_003468 [Malus baccata]|uniref:Uncharacterized protein n=1 Tax=Malus baccata TaxID=106549 RepID=A0A540NIP5_MALBA|nr:hypothetical protein C1H46_003468 [Malus baccata]
MRSDPNASFRTKICEILKAFGQKDLSLHNIRNTGVQDGSDHGIGAVESSPNIVTDSPQGRPVIRYMLNHNTAF